MSKRVLIITYYWPPAGGAGVQRWLKFVKYLPQFGWEPVVYTVEDGEFPVLDHSLEKDIPPDTEVVRRKIFEPYIWYKRFLGLKPDERISAGFLSDTEKPVKKEKIARWIRGNFFIPDARKFWIRPSVRFLKKYLAEHPVDLIVSSGPPHSMHLIGLGLRKKLNIPWVADFRDPWTRIDFYEELLLSKWADRKHHRLEEKVIQNADAVISVSRTVYEEFSAMGAKASFYIPNGYDPQDLQGTESPSSVPDKFRILHAGSINPARNPELLWKVLTQLVKAQPSFADDLEIQLVGKADISVKKSLEQYDLMPYTTFVDYVPHEDVFRLERNAAILLLLINRNTYAKRVVPGKLFEYLAAGRPILALGPPDGESAKILHETKHGTAIDYEDHALLNNYLKEMYASFKQKNTQDLQGDIARYSRKNLAHELANTLEKLLNP